MSEGYLTASGEWIPGAEATDSFQGQNRSAILSSEPDFAERAVQYRPSLINTALITTPIIVDHLPSADTIEDVARRSVLGGWSYFEDMYWYGFGLVAASNGLGQTQYENAHDTIRAVERIITDMLRPTRGVGYSVPKRLCIAFGLYANYTYHHGAPEFFGRTIAGFALAAGLERVTGVVSPWAWRIHGFALTMATTFGSFVRLGDKFRRDFGSLDDMTALDLMIVAMNGSADPRALRENGASMKEAFVNRLYDIADRLEHAGQRPWINVIRGITDMTHHRHELAYVGNRLRILADRLAVIPVYGLLDTSNEFYDIALEARKELLDIRESPYWDELPLDIKGYIELYINLFNPFACDLLTNIFTIFLDASKNGLVMGVPAATMTAMVNGLNSRPFQ